MTARVFSLDEVATRIVTHLLAIDGEKSTVALALTCRALEVPALRTLWETKPCSPEHFIMQVLPRDVWFICPDPNRRPDLHLLKFLRPLTPSELGRLKRYASWIRWFSLHEWCLSEEVAQLFVPVSTTSTPILHFHLRQLNFWLHPTNYSILLKFLSPHLTSINISTDHFGGPGEGLPPHLRPVLASTMRSAITMFPSSIQYLGLRLGRAPETELSEDISAFVLRCGGSFREVDTDLILSTQAIVHLMKLPNLDTWVTYQGPPQVTDLIRHGVPDGASSLFSSLRALHLNGDAALEWLSLFESTKKRAPPWIMAGDSLSTLTYRNASAPIDSSLLSRFLPFTHLVNISLDTFCTSQRCASRFTDTDVETLGTALPNLENLLLSGWPCRQNTCATTVRSLLSLSIHCTKLSYLCIHFRTDNLPAEIMNLLEYAYSQDLHSRPKCVLQTLVTGAMRVDHLIDHETKLVLMGILMVFPALTEFISDSPFWVQLKAMVKDLDGLRMEIAAARDELMSSLREEKECAGEGVPLDILADEIARMICAVSFPNPTTSGGTFD